MPIHIGRPSLIACTIIINIIFLNQLRMQACHNKALPVSTAMNDDNGGVDVREKVRGSSYKRASHAHTRHYIFMYSQKGGTRVQVASFPGSSLLPPNNFTYDL